MKAARRIVYETTYNPIIEYFNWINSNRKKVGNKVYRVYKELVRLIHDPNSEWEYNPKRANHAIEFIENYCRHSKGKMGGKPFILELWEKALVAAAFGIVHKIDGTRKYQEVMLIVARKNGKSTLAAAIGLYLQIADQEPGSEIFAVAPLALETKIPTTSGMKTMGEIKIGDYVFTPQGKPTRVYYISPIVLYDTYKIYFDDGATVIATGNHLWEIEELCSNGLGKPLAWKRKTVATKDIKIKYGGRKASRIKIASAYEMEDKSLPIKPYTLGVWLGDGRNNRGMICGHCSDSDVIEGIKSDGYEISFSKQQSNTRYYTVLGLRTLLRVNNLLNNKHIPEEYFFASVSQRRRLLMGLMDTDGTITKTGECRYTGNCYNICRDVHRLVKSLGYKAHIHETRDQNGKPIWIISFKALQNDGYIFDLKRKRDRQPVKGCTGKTKYRYITEIKKIDPLPCRCISVDDPQNLFVIGEELIITHNTKKDQAKIIWLEAKRMVKKSPVLLKRIKPLVAEMVADFNDSFFKPLGSDSDTLDGLNVHGALLDEIHAWKDKNLYDVIVDGTGTREQPLILITSTAGTIRESIYDLKYDEAEMVINGYEDPNGYKNERLLPIIYELDKRDEWMDPEAWMKANPGLGTIKKLDTLQSKVNKAKANPILVKNLICKDFNVRETTHEAWLPFEAINNTATFDIAKLKPKYGIGGTDLSSTTDLTAAKVIFMVPGDPHIYVLQMYWLPEDLLEKRTKEDKIPYDIWQDRGLLRVSPGNKVHPKHVTEWFVEIREKHGIYLPWIGYDAWSADYWVEEMAGQFGKEAMIKVHQGKKTLSGPMKSLGADLESKLIVYNNNPIDKWCLSNTAIDIDKNDNIQPVKTSNQRRRIDGTAALLNAYVVLQDKLSDYLNMI